MSPQAARQILPQHRVTAILVAHDGVRWLPEVLAAIVGQIRPADLLIAVDTGSVDATRALLAEEIHQDDIVTIGRNTGFGAAVAAGVAHIGNLGPLPAPQPHRPFPLRAEELFEDEDDGGDGFETYGPYDIRYDSRHDGEEDDEPADDEFDDLPEPTDGADWIWLLHDDVAPEPDALLRLIELAESSPTAAVVGPKVRDWDDPRLLVEVGLTIDHSGRKETGLEGSEFDQGQHDAVRDVLAVGSAAMLVRRDVWDELGGFDPRLPIFRDDIDFGWRANAAGHRVVVAPASRVRHARASSTGRRRIRCAVGRASELDRRHSLAVTLANVSALSLVWNIPRLLVGALLRTAGFLLTRQVHAATDELRAIGWNLRHVPSLIRARTRRLTTRKVKDREFRQLFAGRAARLRGYLEAAGDWLTGGAAEPGLATGGDDDDVTAPSDEIAVASRGSRALAVLRRPPVLLALALVSVSLIAARGLFGSGSLVSSLLLPPPDSAADLWSVYAAPVHDVGSGSAAAAPPWIALFAAAASALFGKPWLAVDIALLLCVPLAALSAYFAVRRATGSLALRIWAAVAYATLPAVTGAVAGGRLDVAVAAVVLPLIASSAYRAISVDPAVGGWRHAFVAGLALAVGAAFVPQLWLLAAMVMLGGVGFLAVREGEAARAVSVRRLLAALSVLATAFAVLMPWSLRFASTPGVLLRGLTPEPPVLPLRAVNAVLLRPGGEAMPPRVLPFVLLLAAVPALLRSDPKRRAAALACWIVAVAAMAFAVIATRAESVAGWPGPALLVAGGAIITAAVIGASGGHRLLGRVSFGWRQPTALLIGALALIGPLLALGTWTMRGAARPLGRHTVVSLPQYVVAQGEQQDGLRALWLRPAPTPENLRYSVTSLDGGTVGDDQLLPRSSVRTRLDVVVADLAARRGSDAGQALSTYGVRFVVVRAPAPPALAATLDAQPALTRERADERAGVQMWRVLAPTGRVLLLEPGAAEESQLLRAPSLGTLRNSPPRVLPADPRTGQIVVPPGRPGRLLVVSEDASGPWQVTTTAAVQPARAWGWARAVRVPSSGATVTVAPDGSTRRSALFIQGALLLLALILAAPNVRRAEEETAEGVVEDDKPHAVEDLSGVPA